MTKQKIEIEIDDVPEGCEDAIKLVASAAGKIHLRFLPPVNSSGPQQPPVPEAPTPPALDAELRVALLQIVNNCGEYDGWDNQREQCVGCIRIVGSCPRSYDLNKMSQVIMENRTKILAEAARLKKQRKDEAIEKERKRVVRKWCRVFDSTDDRTHHGILRIVDHFLGFGAEYKYKTGNYGWKYAEPLTDTQLTALGLEND